MSTDYMHSVHIGWRVPVDQLPTSMRTYEPEVCEERPHFNQHTGLQDGMWKVIVKNARETWFLNGLKYDEPPTEWAYYMSEKHEIDVAYCENCGSGPKDVVFGVKLNHHRPYTLSYGVSVDIDDMDLPSAEAIAEAKAKIESLLGFELPPAKIVFAVYAN